MGDLEHSADHAPVTGQLLTDRPTWDQTWLATAGAISFRSLCDRRQVGAVIVTSDNRVASFSYNGPPKGMQVEGSCINWCPRAKSQSTSADYSSCPAVHAEANAIIRADYKDIAGGTIYVTSAMCINCAKIIANSGLHKVIHVVGPNDEYRHPDDVEKFLQDSGLTTARVRFLD